MVPQGMMDTIAMALYTRWLQMHGTVTMGTIGNHCAVMWRKVASTEATMMVTVSQLLSWTGIVGVAISVWLASYNMPTRVVVWRVNLASGKEIRGKTFGEHQRQKRSTEGCSKFKSPETRQVQEKLVSTLEHMQVPKWDRTRCPEE